MNNIRSTKIFRGYPCTHRQYLDDSHCRWVHGYSRSFHFEFGCLSLDKKGWVVPFGGLTDMKQFLSSHFDHTFLVGPEDPELETFKSLQDRDALKLVVLPYGPSMEGTARYVYEECDKIINRITNGRCFITKVEVRENEKNSGIYLSDRA